MFHCSFIPVHTVVMWGRHHPHGHHHGGQGERSAEMSNPVSFRYVNKYAMNKSDRIQTTDAFWQSARLLVSEIHLVSDRPTDGRTDRQTGTSSLRDASAHLKMRPKKKSGNSCFPRIVAIVILKKSPWWQKHLF